MRFNLFAAAGFATIAGFAALAGIGMTIGVTSYYKERVNPDRYMIPSGQVYAAYHTKHSVARSTFALFDSVAEMAIPGTALYALDTLAGTVRKVKSKGGYIVYAHEMPILADTATPNNYQLITMPNGKGRVIQTMPDSVMLKKLFGDTLKLRKRTIN